MPTNLGHGVIVLVMNDEQSRLLTAEALFNALAQLSPLHLAAKATGERAAAHNKAERMVDRRDV